MKIQNKTTFLLISAFLLSLSASAQEMGDFDIMGDSPSDKTFSEAELGLKSKKPADLTIKTEGKKNAIRADIRLVNKAPIAFELEVEGEKKPKKFEMRISEQKWEVERSFQEKSDLRARGVITEGADNYKGYAIEFNGLNFTYFIKPNFSRYSNNDVKKFIPEWEKMFPEYQNKTFHFEILPDENNVQIWLDGRLCGTLENAGRIKSLRIKGGMGPDIKASAFEYDFSTPYLPLAMYDTVYSGTELKKARLSIGEGLKTIENIPFNAVSGERAIEPARHRKMRGLYDLVMDPYTSRTAFDSMPESMHYSIPQTLYSRAYVLCGIVPSKGKDGVPSFGIRLTRFGAGTRGRGGAISDNYFDFSKSSDMAKKVGVIDIGSKKMDLFLVEVPLNTGSILDLASPDEVDKRQAMRIGKYLDLEFLADSKSPIALFGVTLERSSLTMKPAFTHPGNIFTADETPETLLKVYSRSAGNSGELVYTITDSDNKEISKKTIPLSFPEAMKEKILKIDLAQQTPGWYGIRYDLYDSKKRLDISHKASFALLPVDDREAGYESPFGVWAFGGEHNTETDIDKIGELCLKAGFRKITAVGTEEKMKKYKTTLNQILCFRNFKPEEPEKSAEAFRAWIKRSLDAFPSCTAIDIFHEYGGIGIASQMFGAEAKINVDDPLESKDARTRGAAMMADIVKKEFPQLKILFGNSCASGELVAWSLDQGLSEKHIDYVGIETPAYHGLPERPDYLKVPATWCTIETVKKYGRNIPVSGCFEFTYRSERRFAENDKNTHARHYMRDILQGLAFGFDHVTPAILDDSGAAYYHGNWGGSGYVERNPYLYPKRAYVAAATLTRALDKGKFIKSVDDGSNSCYMLEFERKRKTPDFAYALWTPKYDAQMEITFPSNAKVEIIEMYGDSRKGDLKNGKLIVPMGPSPCYVISNVKALSAKATYLPEVRNDLVKMTYQSDFNLFTDYSLYSVGGLPSRIPGEFDMTLDKDKTISLTLKGRENLPEIVNEYAIIRPATPVLIPENAKEIGIWVDGNSSFGAILFEITDSEGKIWRSHMSDDSLITYDSWHFASAKLDGGFARMTKGKTDKIAFPVKLTGIVVETAQNSLDPSSMKPVSKTLRFKDISYIPK